MFPKPGALVRLLQNRENVAISARREPKRLALFQHPDSSNKLAHDNVICFIPAGDQALYMGTKRDALHAALTGRAKSPYGFRPGEVTFHLILWGQRPVWVSSEDATLEVIS